MQCRDDYLFSHSLSLSSLCEAGTYGICFVEQKNGVRSSREKNVFFIVGEGGIWLSLLRYLTPAAEVPNYARELLDLVG